MAAEDLIVGEESKGWAEGAGILSSMSNLYGDFTSDSDAMDFTIDGVSAGLDVLITVVDPFGAAISAGVGWLLEHVPWISDLWDRLAGDPGAIQAVALTWDNISTQLGTSADAFNDLVSGMSNWTGPAAQTFFKAATDYDTILRGVAGETQTMSYWITGIGAVVAALREVCYWVIASWLQPLIIEALAALAASWVSFGSSIAAFLAWMTISTSITYGILGEKVAAASVKVAEIYARIGVLLASAEAGARTGRAVSQGLIKLAEQADQYAKPIIAGGSHVNNRDED
ncbi:PPE domain-containing protein [Nocardioides sp. Root140]|uniref:PPE domain-containing protein n=1 Tax=Nocardioides sp. Root140 TaxID=1736460 RepID=UPI0006F58633|nr:PPE domain-containing protein [Nocardioides sp. Root140]KQY55487.1 hypothetical protein ASD30_16420 [Nocardioides sp. Root140]